MSTKPDTTDYDLLWLRNYGNLTQEEAGLKMDPQVSRSTYIRWERGDIPARANAYGQLAAAVGIALSEIPHGLAETAKQTKEADEFDAEVRKILGTPGEVKLERVILSHGLGAGDDFEVLPKLPPIEYPQHAFRPYVMRKFNIPERRWVPLVVELPGEDVEALKLGGYSWDQAVTWKDETSKARAYAMLKVWEAARDEHFRERLLKAREEKTAMPPMIYVRILAIFDHMMEEQGLDLV